MLAYYIKKVIEHGFVGFACVNAPATMAPWGGREKVFGTNPMCVGFPIDERKTIILDMATSVMAHFKIKVAALKGEKISEGVALDKQGRPTTDSKEAFEGVLLPFGGYKGYGLALAIEVLTSALLGAPQSKNIPLHPSTQGEPMDLALSIANPVAFVATGMPSPFPPSRRDMPVDSLTMLISAPGLTKPLRIPSL